MKTIFILLSITFCLIFSNTIQAQEVKRPLTAKVTNEEIPASPGENWTWVKGHWKWDGGKYVWKKGMFTEKRTGSIWIDGEWERNQKSGWWKFNHGYWQKKSVDSEVSNDKNTLEKDRASKEKRKENKSGGLYIKTGNSK